LIASVTSSAYIQFIGSNPAATQEINMSNRIQAGTFAEACFNNNTVAELQAASAAGPDAADMEAWNITAQEWRDAIAQALAAKLEG